MENKAICAASSRNLAAATTHALPCLMLGNSAAASLLAVAVNRILRELDRGEPKCSHKIRKLPYGRSQMRPTRSDPQEMDRKLPRTHSAKTPPRISRSLLVLRLDGQCSISLVKLGELDTAL